MIDRSLSFMNWVPAEIPQPKPVKPRSLPTTRKGRGLFAASMQSRYSHWQLTLEAAHKEIQQNLTALRAHSRELTRDNPYGRRFVNLCSTHIVGPEGIAFESSILGNGKKPKTDWNDTIEAQWLAWGEECTTDGQSSWTQFTQLVAETTATDGESFIHHLRGFPNAWGYAVELIDADRVDWTWNQPVDPYNGERTIMGIRLDRYGRRLGYYVWSAHPMDYEGAPRREFIPARDITHVYDERRARSTRGIPWMTSVMVPLSMLGSLLNAELKSANFDARRVMLVKGPAPAIDDTTDGDHPATATTDPAGCAADLQKELRDDDITILGLDPGTEGQFPPSNHPNPAIQEFAKNLLKMISTGVSVSYHCLTSDVSDANYTASRVASLDERDQWSKLQGWFIHSVNRPVFAAWLEMSVLSGAISLPVVDWKKLLAPKWWPRTWEWVDPLKETQAAVLAIRSGLSTYSEELGGLGRNWRKSFRQRKEEQSFEVELGLHLELDSAKAGANAPSDPAYADDENTPPPTKKPTTTPAKGGNDGTE